MAQATFSWPCGPIHLERRQGVGAIGRNGCAAPASMSPFPTPSGPSGHLPLIGESAPDPILRERQLGRLFCRRKGAGGSADCFFLVFRCRFVVAKSACLRFRLTAKTAPASLLLLSNANPLRWALRWGPPSAAYMIRLRGLGTPLFESAFVAVGLKYGSGKRRTWATLRFSRRARCPHRAVLGRPGVPPLRRESKPDSAFSTGDREGRPYGFTKAYLKPWRAGEDTRPYGVFNTGSVCSVNPGAVVEPHQRKFMQTQGPVARQEFRPATQILRAGNIAKPNKYASPVMGVRG